MTGGDRVIPLITMSRTLPLPLSEYNSNTSVFCGVLMVFKVAAAAAGPQGNPAVR